MPNELNPTEITWDEPPQTVAPAEGSRQGGVIITDPTVSSGERRDDARLTLEERRVLIAEERAGREAAKFAEKQEKQAAVIPRDINDIRFELENVISKAREAKKLSHEWFATGFGAEAARATGGTAATDVAALLDTIGSSVAFDRLTRMRAESPTGGAVGNVSDRDLELLKATIASLNQAQSDEQFRSAMDDVINSYQRVLDKIPQETSAEPDRESPLTPTGEAPRAEIGGTGERYLTDEDRALQARIGQAWQEGADLSTLQAIAAEFGRTFPLTSQEELDAARAAGRSVNVQQSGVRSEAEQLLGGVADSEWGAYLIGATNALLSGAMDELSPVLGLDPEVVRAANEKLREENPFSSFAGEVSGQAMQLAAGGAALRAGGAGAGTLAGAEIAQGAAYGAGEANENRLAGAAVGAGAAVVGQQIAKRLFGSPAQQEAIQKAADDAGVPKEALEEVLGRALSEETQTETGALVRKAVTSGPGSKEAKRKLAVLAQVNPEAKEAAERLGMDLPLDVLSDDTRLLTTAGLARSQIGSEAKDAWGKQLSDTIERADAAIAEVGGTKDLAQVGFDVMDRLELNIDALERQGARLRSAVDEVIDVRDRVEAVNLQESLARVINDMGGIEDAKQAFSAEERKMFNMLGEGDTAKAPTYARLNQMRDQIGQALFKGQGPWADTAQANLKRYYGALAEDQLAYVQSVGGKEIADQMRASNDVFSKMYDARRTMQSVYGAKLDKDLPPLINRALTKATNEKRPDMGDLRKLLNAVPEDMHKEVLLSGLLQSVQRPSGAGGFSFKQFSKLYRGMVQNKEVYKTIAKGVGSEGERVLRDLYAISRRVSAAEDKIVRTGASNQPLINALNAENFVAKVMSGTARRAVVTGGSAGVGGIVGGPVGGAASASVAEALQEVVAKGGKTRLDKLHNLLSSDSFRDLTEKVATGQETRKSINRIAGDKTYRNFAATVLGLKTPEQRKAWIENAIKGSATAGAVSTQRPEEQPTTIIEVN